MLRSGFSSQSCGGELGLSEGFCDGVVELGFEDCNFGGGADAFTSALGGGLKLFVAKGLPPSIRCGHRGRRRPLPARAPSVVKGNRVDLGTYRSDWM